MTKVTSWGAGGGALLSLVLLCSAAQAITVTGKDVIYAAGNQSGLAGTIFGNVPPGVPVGTSASTSVSGLTGSMSVNVQNPAATVDIDGLGSFNGSKASSSLGTQWFSGITAPGTGYLMGVFVAANGPTGPAPPALNFMPSGLGTNFTSLSPLLDQVFFIGDGLTGTGAGTQQVFNIPAGAATLFFGISDGCTVNGSPPGCYGDNTPTAAYVFNVQFSGSPGGSVGGSVGVPEPGSLLLIGAGLAGLALVRRRKG